MYILQWMKQIKWKSWSGRVLKVNYIFPAQPEHDPNTQHCLCGADADLIMLGLATHEPNFTIIREEFKPNQPRPCDICGQLGEWKK